MGKTPPPAEHGPSFTVMLCRFALVTAWRFHTGHHMDGRRRQTGSGKVLPQHADYFWNRYSRKRRAAWRNGFFVLAVLATFGLLKFRTDTIFLAFSLVPFLLFRVAGKLRKVYFHNVSFHSGDGESVHYWVLRPKYKRWIRKLKPAKVVVDLPDGGPVPPEFARAILADNAESGGAPVASLRMAGETSRSRTIRRNYQRRIPK
jgi:hypothetical protein